MGPARENACSVLATVMALLMVLRIAMGEI